MLFGAFRLFRSAWAERPETFFAGPSTCLRLVCCSFPSCCIAPSSRSRSALRARSPFIVLRDGPCRASSTLWRRSSQTAPAETLLASEKDDAYLQALVSQAVGSAEALLDDAMIEQWRAEIGTAVKLAYLTLTAGCGGPTPGEEYCDISRVHWDNRRPAGKGRRFWLVLMQILLPYLYRRFSAQCLAVARRCEDSQRQLLQLLAPQLPAIAHALGEMHRALFLLRGNFYLLRSGSLPLVMSATPDSRRHITPGIQRSVQ